MVFVAWNIYLHGMESVNSTTLKYRLRQIVPNFATGSSGVFADVEARGDESENH